jgi:GDP-L-fucose synthase
LIRKIHAAKIAGTDAVVWGTGNGLREFLHADDLADACVYLMKNYSDSQLINVGSGREISIRDLAYLIADIVGFRGRIVFDVTKPDGTPRKLVNSDRLRALGWTARTELRSGIEQVYLHWLDKVAMPA